MYIVCSIYIIYIYVVQKTYTRVGTNYYYYIIIYMHNLYVKEEEDDGRGNRKLLMIAKLLYESWIIISGKR